MDVNNPQSHHLTLGAYLTFCTLRCVLSQVHVVFLLELNCRLAVVSGVDNGVFGQGEQLLAYCIYQGAMVAVGEIGAAYAATEQGIAAEEHLCFGYVVCKTAW